MNQENLARLVKLAGKKGLTIGSCESFTAGLFCASLASVPGASAVLKGGLVTYCNEIKAKIAHVNPELLKQKGAVSPEVCTEMAVNARELLGVDYGVSFTGNAGPSAQDGVAVGTFYIGISKPGLTIVYKCYSSRPRNQLREEAVDLVVEKLLDAIEMDGQFLIF